MKVGLLTSDLTLQHGWGTYSLQIIAQLRRQGIDLTVIDTRDSTDQRDFSAQHLLPSVVQHGRFWLPRALMTIPRLRALTADCDVLHSAVERFAPLVTTIANARPVFQTIHGSYAHLPRVQRWPWRALYRRAYLQAHLVCVSHYTQRVVQQIVPEARSTVIPNGVNLDDYATLPRQPDPRPTILTVGGIKTRKGTLPLVRAIARVRDVFPDVLCVIVGNQQVEPDTTAAVRAEIVQHGLQDHVLLTGFIDQAQLHQWYSRAHLFVLPSINAGWKFEGFGLVHLEASAAGLPVIGTRDCGAEDAIVHEETGLLIDQALIDDQLPQAITALLSDPPRARAYGKRGRQRAKAYTWAHTTAGLIALYDAALSDRP